MEIEINLEKNDWDLFLTYCNKALPMKAGNWLNGSLFKTGLCSIYAFVGIIILKSYCCFHKPTAIATLVYSVAAFLTISLINMKKLRKAFAPNMKGVFIGTHKFIFSDEGIESQGEGYRSSYSWAIVKNIERSNGLIMIFLDTSYAFIFPENKLRKPDEFYRFIVEKGHKMGI